MLVKLGGGVGHIKASFQEEAMPELISKGRIRILLQARGEGISGRGNSSFKSMEILRGHISHSLTQRKYLDIQNKK